jgi:uncharacterized protein
MKILVMSDTHSNFPLAVKAHSLSEPVDWILHLGDGCGDVELLRDLLGIPVVAVAGNCDHGSKAPRELLWECEGHKFLLSHGDYYGVKGGLIRLELRAREVGADAVLFGHSHMALIDQRCELLVLNPGTMAPTAGHRTYAILDVSKDGISACLHDID